MTSLKFGLNTAKPGPGLSKPSQKRKAFFDNDNDEVEEDDAPSAPQTAQKKAIKPLKPLSGFGDAEDEDDDQPVRKSPKLSNTAAEKYMNLSSLRSAKLHDQQASQIDASVYDYDGAYETFHAPKESKNGANGNASQGPKYMTALMQSAEVRKRDQLRAQEKLLQKEREAEGEEFADKEKFVTGAYKKQQEEVKRLEEEEKKREEEEEERRRKGGGMLAFHKRMLEKDEERMKAIEEAKIKREQGGDVPEQGEAVEEDDLESKKAKELNEKGARIVVNDEGDVVDKRQLLSAGLNTAPKKPGMATQQAGNSQSGRSGQEYYRSTKAQDARQSQRERQTRMMERQIEEMAEKQRQAEIEEQKAQEEKTKSKITESEKMSAKERYLQRKNEREEEAKKAKEAKKSAG